MKSLFKFLLILLLLLGAGLILALSLTDTAVRNGVEKGGKYALGVDTSLEGAKLQLTAGRLDLDQLVVGNPAGFGDHPAFVLGKGELELKLADLTKDVIEVPLLAFSDVQFNLDRSSKGTNIAALLDHVNKLSGGSAPSEEDAAENGSSKRFLVRELRIEGVKANFNLLPGALPGVLSKLDGSAEGESENRSVSLELEPIVLTDLDSSGEGMDAGALVQTVLEALLNSTLESSAGQIPAELLADYKNQIADVRAKLDGAKQKAQEQVNDALEQGKQMGEQLGKDAEGQLNEGLNKVEDAVNEQADKLNDKLGGLLGGGKDKQDG